MLDCDEASVTYPYEIIDYKLEYATEDKMGAV